MSESTIGCNSSIALGGFADDQIDLRQQQPRLERLRRGAGIGRRFFPLQFDALFQLLPCGRQFSATASGSTFGFVLLLLHQPQMGLGRDQQGQRITQRALVDLLERRQGFGRLALHQAGLTQGNAGVVGLRLVGPAFR